MTPTQFDVLSPDGFSIHHSDTYPTIDAAVDALKQWVKRYEFQGYYSSMNYGRIPLEDVHEYCNIIEVSTVNEDED